MTVGMKLEVINVHTHVQTPTNVYWIATVLRLEGEYLSLAPELYTLTNLYACGDSVLS